VVLFATVGMIAALVHDPATAILTILVATGTDGGRRRNIDKISTTGDDSGTRWIEFNRINRNTVAEAQKLREAGLITDQKPLRRGPP
jgi:hypothetical protein